MKKIILFITVCCSFNAFAFKAGKVNLQKILVTVNESKGIKSSLEKAVKKKEGILKKEGSEIKKLQKSFESSSMVMSDKAKEKKGREIQEKIVKYQQKVQVFQQELQEMEQKAMAPLIKKITSVIGEVSKSKKLDLTYEGKSLGILYVSKEIDITDDVIKAYNKKDKK